MEKLNDYSPMPIRGRYQGVAMANVPADYLLQFYYQGHKNEEVQNYIVENLDVLTKEIEQLGTDEL